MSSVAASYRENPWYRVVRCLVVISWGSLEAEDRAVDRGDGGAAGWMRGSMPSSRGWMRSARICEDLRDGYLAWLADPCGGDAARVWGERDRLEAAAAGAAGCGGLGLGRLGGAWAGLGVGVADGTTDKVAAEDRPWGGDGRAPGQAGA
jgi:hypothetical protein